MSADVALGLKRRHRADGVLKVTDRDIDEAEYGLTFHAASGAWQLLEGPASGSTLHETPARILRYLRDYPATGPTAVALATGIGVASVKQTYRRMVNDGQLRVAAGGKYRPVESPADQSPPSLGHPMLDDQPYDDDHFTLSLP